MAFKSREIIVIGQCNAGHEKIIRTLFPEDVLPEQNADQKDLETHVVRFSHLSISSCVLPDAFDEFFSGDVIALVFVMNVFSGNPRDDFHSYDDCIAAVLHYSPRVKIFIYLYEIENLLTNKMQSTFNNYERNFIRADYCECARRYRKIFATESLESIWTEIMKSTYSNWNKLERVLEQFLRATDLLEVQLVEKCTYLTVKKITAVGEEHDIGQLEVDRIKAEFRKTTATKSPKIRHLCERFDNAFIVIFEFTPKSDILVISKNYVGVGIIALNLKAARPVFIKLESEKHYDGPGIPIPRVDGNQLRSSPFHGYFSM